MVMNNCNDLRMVKNDWVLTPCGPQSRCLKVADISQNPRQPSNSAYEAIPNLSIGINEVILMDQKSYPAYSLFAALLVWVYVVQRVALSDTQRSEILIIETKKETRAKFGLAVTRSARDVHVHMPQLCSRFV